MKRLRKKDTNPNLMSGALEMSDCINLSSMDHNLTIVLFGNNAAVQFQLDNILFEDTQPSIENAAISRTLSSQMKISGRRVSVINMIGLHEAALDLEPLTRRLVNENKIIAFIFVVRLGQLTDEDKMGIEWLQRVFGDQVLQFVMILFTYESEEESDSIIDDLKKNSALEQLIEKCGGRYYTCSKNMSSQSQIRDLIDMIERRFTDNKQWYTTEMYKTTLKERRGLQNRTCQNDQPTITEDSLEHTTIEKPKAKVDKHSEDGARLNLSKGSGSSEKIYHLFDSIKLDHNCKLKSADVLQLTAHSLQSHESCAEKDLIQTFLQNLLMMNYEARNMKTTDAQHDRQPINNDLSEDEDDVNFFTEMALFSEEKSKRDVIHPMDVQMAVFHCADSFLKQLMVTKLSQCQYALPLLVPDPFTQEIEFPLWTFRQINKSWKIKGSTKISQIEPVWKAEGPMVFFFRFGSVSSSKSQLMNSLINEKHNTFFHRNCPGSTKTRVLMDGVVEIAWFCPSGKDKDKFNQFVAFCNLHGDAGDNEKQLQILTDMASVNVVILTHLDLNEKNAKNIQNLYKNGKPLICLFTEAKCSLTETRKEKYKIGLNGRNQSDVCEDLKQAINKCLSSPKSPSVFRLEDVSKQSGIIVDEDLKDDCKRGKAAAQQMIDLLKKINLTEIKESFLPCQGKLWHQWCQKNKERHQTHGYDIEMEINQKQEMIKFRKDQFKSDVGQFIKLFIKEMNSESPNEKIFFLKWLTILLDAYTSADLSALHYEYHKRWSNARVKQQIADEHTELNKITEELQAATFGLEHIIREIGQIYESCKSENKNKEGLPCHFTSLPSLGADMMISGFPLELMDGDAAHVPVDWVSAVLQELIQKLGDKRIFVLSVLGIQSSGKSTMLNALFGLQFAVSAGRCTKGAFMQLVKVSEGIKMKEQMKVDYILVVDTEGLHTLQLSGKSSRHQDNELATFIVGLGNLTLINIFGESPSEIQEILQIVVQAFMRMKKVKLNPSSMFVHQNVSDITAGEKTMEERRRLQETLDEMTKLAAKDEVCDAECFNDIINFDIQKDVKYFAQLWEGSPPMAPPNPSYCENIQELKQTIFSHASKSDGLELTHLKKRVNDLWEALLNEQFVFSFKNSLEIATYRKLETEYSKWSWSLRRTMLDIENELHNNIENETINGVSEMYLQRKLEVKSEEVEKSISEFFQNEKDKEILIQWKETFNIKIKELKDSIVRETMTKLNEIFKQREIKKGIDDQKTHHEKTLLEKSKELAMTLRDKAHDKTILKIEFESFWKECVKKINSETPPIEDIDVLTDLKLLLSDIYKSVPVDAWKECRDIFSVPSYSDYVQLRKPSEITSHAENDISIKEKLGYKLAPEEEPQIRSLVDDIAHYAEKMIISYNIAKMGYNKTCIQELADYIKAKVVQYEEGSRNYIFTKEFYIHLLVSICERENHIFTTQYRMFREANDPVLYFQKKSDEYYSVFQKYCKGATSTTIFGEIICQKLKDPIQNSVFKNTARDLASEIKANCESLNGNRSKLEKHILKALAEQEDFKKYINYIDSPRDHLKSFIRDEVNRYITDHFKVSVLPKMNQSIEYLQNKIKEAAHSATEVSKTGLVQDWLNLFTKQLSDVLKISVKDFSAVNHEGVDDLNLLKDVVTKELVLGTSEIKQKFSLETFPESLEHSDRPDEILIEQLCKCCWVQCPFCAATCTNTIEKHSGDHSVPFHRVGGLTGCCYRETENLCADFCTTLVRTDNMFYVGQWILCREYKKAGGIYMEWSITPDVSELPYWKWFVCRFQKELKEHFGKTFHEWNKISHEWSQYSKEQAISSLDKYF